VVTSRGEGGKDAWGTSLGKKWKKCLDDCHLPREKQALQIETRSFSEKGEKREVYRPRPEKKEEIPSSHHRGHFLQNLKKGCGSNIA